MKNQKKPASLVVRERRCYVAVETSRAEHLRILLRDNHIGSDPPHPLGGEYVTFALGEDVQEAAAGCFIDRWNHDAYGT